VRLATAGLSSSRLEAVTAALLTLPCWRSRSPFHQNGVVGGFHLSTGLGVVADGAEAILAGCLNVIKTGIRGNAEPLVGAGAIGSTGKWGGTVGHGLQCSGQSDSPSVSRRGAGGRSGKVPKHDSEERFAELIAILLLQITAPGLGFFSRQPVAVLEQGHLGRQMAAFVHFDGFLTG